MPSFPEPPLEILDRARTGNREAFGEIVRMTQDLVVALSRRILGNRALAEECAQDAYLRAYRGLPSFQPGRPFAPWLAAITVNRARSLRSRAASPGSRVPLESLPAAEGSGNGDLDSGLRLAVDGLPLPYREAVTLHYLCGFDCASVARITGRAEGTVKSDLLRGRAILRRRLAPQFLEGGRP